MGELILVGYFFLQKSLGEAIQMRGLWLWGDAGVISPLVLTIFICLEKNIQILEPLSY